MVVQAGMGFYHVGAANTNRIKRFSIESGVVNAFLFLRGQKPFYPFVGQFDTWNSAGAVGASTVNQQIANYRVDAIIRSLSIYAPPVELSIVNGSQTASQIQIGFETFESNVFPSGADIVDTLGLAGQSAKTKLGLQSLATALLAAASLDGGTTLLFAVNPNLPNLTATTAPVIASLTVAALN